MDSCKPCTEACDCKIAHIYKTLILSLPTPNAYLCSSRTRSDRTGSRRVIIIVLYRQHGPYLHLQSSSCMQVLQRHQIDPCPLYI